MAVKIRLARRGRKKLALFDLIIADSRSARNGRFIEKIGTYNPLTNPATLNFDEEKAFQWLMKGAQPTDTVRAMLSYRGILFRKHLQVGVTKGAITQEQADQKLEAWRKEKEGQIQAKRDRLATEKGESARARKEAETKIRTAREEAIRKRNDELVKAAEEAEAAATATEEKAPEDSAAPEATATEGAAPAEPAPAASAEENAPAPTAEDSTPEAAPSGDEPKA